MLLTPVSVESGVVVPRIVQHPPPTGGAGAVQGFEEVPESGRVELVGLPSIKAPRASQSALRALRFVFGQSIREHPPQPHGCVTMTPMEVKTISPFLDYFNKIRERTMRVVACIPPDKVEWRAAPDEL